MFDERNITFKTAAEGPWIFVSAMYRRDDGGPYIDSVRILGGPDGWLDRIDEARRSLVASLRERYNRGQIVCEVPGVPRSYEELDQSDDLHDDPKDTRREALPSKTDYWDYDDPF